MSLSSHREDAITGENAVDDLVGQVSGEVVVAIAIDVALKRQHSPEGFDLSICKCVVVFFECPQEFEPTVEQGVWECVAPCIFSARKMPLAQRVKAAELCLHRFGKGLRMLGGAFCRLFGSFAARM